MTENKQYWSDNSLARVLTDAEFLADIRWSMVKDALDHFSNERWRDDLDDDVRYLSRLEYADFKKNFDYKVPITVSQLQDENGHFLFYELRHADISKRSNKHIKCIETNKEYNSIAACAKDMGFNLNSFRGSLKMCDNRYLGYHFEVM